MYISYHRAVSEIHRYVNNYIITTSAVFAQSISQRADRNKFDQRINWGFASAAVVILNISVRIDQSELSAVEATSEFESTSQAAYQSTEAGTHAQSHCLNILVQLIAAKF